MEPAFSTLQQLNALQHAIEERDFAALLSLTEAYSASIRQWEGEHHHTLAGKILTAHLAIETSLHQLQREIETMIHQVTHHKIDHAYRGNAS